MRSLEELTATDEPAWPLVGEWIAQGAVEVSVLPVDPPGSGAATLYRLQVTARSPLGALALNTGGLLVDGGWLRVLGAGAPGLVDLATANGLDKVDDPDRGQPPGHLVVGFDVLGGTFAVNHTDLPAAPGEVCYFGPDTLDWSPLGLTGHGHWLQWALSGGLSQVFADLRWPGWQTDIAGLAPGQGMHVYPPLFSVEGRRGPVSRRPVPLCELVDAHADVAAQLAAAGDPVRIRVTLDPPAPDES